MFKKCLLYWSIYIHVQDGRTSPFMLHYKGEIIGSLRPFGFSTYSINGFRDQTYNLSLLKCRFLKNHINLKTSPNDDGDGVYDDM